MRLQAIEGEFAKIQVQIHTQKPSRHPGEALDLTIVPGLDTVLLNAEAPGAGAAANVVCVSSLLVSGQFRVGDTQCH
jgi:hypothetical protein